MPANFPEVWLRRVRTNIILGAIAPWIDRVPELDVQVTEVNEGDISEQNTIHIPTSVFKPDVLINNTTYPLALQSYTDSKVTVNLDKYQTLVTTLTDDQVIGAAYPQIDFATKQHVAAILEKKYAKGIHALAPASNVAATPVLLTTGDLVSGRRRLLYDDLVALGLQFDKQGYSKIGRVFVPSPDHYSDMLLDRKNFGDQLVNYREGTIVPKVAGWEIMPAYSANPFYTISTKVKLAFAAVPGAGTSQASVAFCSDGVMKKTGLTKQYFDKPTARNQQNEIAYRHYFICLPYAASNIGAVIDAAS
jgi:hypothetical protein